MIKDDNLATKKLNSRKSKFDIPTYVFHWGIVACLLISFASGMRIAADHHPEWQSAEWFLLLQQLLPQGTVFYWHIVSGIIVSLCVTAYIVFLWLSRQQKRLNLSRGSTIQRSNVLLYWLALVLLLLSLFSGWINALEHPQLSTDFIRSIHFYLGIALIVFPLLHVPAQWLYGGVRHILNSFWFNTRYLRSGSLALLGGILITALIGILVAKPTTLPIKYSTNLPIIDGRTDDAIWQQVNKLTVLTKLGNGDNAITPVDVQAVHDQHNIYFLFSWPDQDKSIQHLPLLKTDQGWSVQHNGFAKDNEIEFYEDKFAVMLSNYSWLHAMLSIHLGPAPIINAPTPRHQRGYHFTEEQQIVDIWHWKSVRGQAYKQADDNYFGPPVTAYSCNIRYKAGYMTDPKVSGGIQHNWEVFYPQQVKPKRLPRSAHLVSDMQNYVARMRWGDAYLYQTDKDKIATGFTIPSILNHDPYQGDRGQVGAVGHWHNGRWYLEITRKLNTGSNYDTEIKDQTYVWLATFDHAQTQHSYHLLPLRIQLQEQP